MIAAYWNRPWWRSDDAKPPNLLPTRAGATVRVMQWADLRAAYPDRWLIIEVFAAHTVGGRRWFDQIGVVEECADGRAAMKRCAVVQRAQPGRDFVFAHTSREELEVYERRWVGVRWGDASEPAA